MFSALFSNIMLLHISSFLVHLFSISSFLSLPPLGFYPATRILSIFLWVTWKWKISLVSWGRDSSHLS